MSSGLSAGLATFNSCNKAGSIPHFTQHLSRYPNDYQALVWRGRAHSIIGNTAEARADFQKACVSFGAKKNLAQALLEHINGNIAQKGAILQNTVRQYPNCSEAWSELGSHTHKSETKTDPALAYLQKASHLATVNNEAKEPWFPWCNQEIGDIYYFEKQQVANARKYYETAVLSGNTLTIGYLGLSRCDILDDNPARAKRYFSTAKSLNPVLVKCETFEKFSAESRAHYNMLKLQSMFLELLTASSESQTVEERQPSSSQRQHGATSRAYRSASASGGVYPSLPSSSQHTTRAESAFTSRQSPMGAHTNAIASQSRQSKGRKGVPEKARGYSTVRSGRRGDGGNGGSGDGSGSDEEESMSPAEKAIQTWKKLKKEAPSRREYHRMQFFQSKCKNFWYSRIASNVRHAGAFFKKYLDRGNTIELLCSTDENLKDMLGKHESGKYGVIKKSDMNGI